jgi:hypothetical protein
VTVQPERRTLLDAFVEAREKRIDRIVDQSIADETARRQAADGRRDFFALTAAVNGKDAYLWE